MRKENSIITNEIENVKNAGIRENTKTRIGNLFFNIYDWFSNLIFSLEQSVENKVDKEIGKGLSEQNFTLEEKNKLSSLENYVKPISESISYIENLQEKLDEKEETKNKVSEIPLNKSDFVNKYPSVKLLNDLFDDLKGKVFNNVVLNINQKQLEFYNFNNEVVDIIPIGFLMTSENRLRFNQLSKKLEIVDKNNVVTSEVEVNTVLNGFPVKINNDNYKIQLKDFNNELVSEIDISNLFTSIITKTELNEFKQNLQIDFSKITNKPTTLSGYGITESYVIEENGKGLSEQNFTLEEKNKLSSLENYVKPISEPISYINGLEPRLVVIENNIIELNKLKSKVPVLSTGTFSQS